ncbi:unnamed protein product [Cuscuta epithymum]|uniref:Uncharacterized protein n=1 Tax=Cuscuta epithymum TaxID=186058 RepID=A0AAV0G3K2_9ASTE|nr:unnamed protein product [Cuscuta epithymum]
MYKWYNLQKVSDPKGQLLGILDRAMHVQQAKQSRSKNLATRPGGREDEKRRTRWKRSTRRRNFCYRPLTFLLRPPSLEAGPPSVREQRGRNEDEKLVRPDGKRMEKHGSPAK